MIQRLSDVVGEEEKAGRVSRHLAMMNAALVYTSGWDSKILQNALVEDDAAAVGSRVQDTERKTNKTNDNPGLYQFSRFVKEE